MGVGDVEAGGGGGAAPSNPPGSAGVRFAAALPAVHTVRPPSMGNLRNDALPVADAAAGSPGGSLRGGGASSGGGSTPAGPAAAAPPPLARASSLKRTSSGLARGSVTGAGSVMHRAASAKLMQLSTAYRSRKQLEEIEGISLPPWVVHPLDMR